MSTDCLYGQLPSKLNHSSMHFTLFWLRSLVGTRTQPRSRTLAFTVINSYAICYVLGHLYYSIIERDVRVIMMSCVRVGGWVVVCVRMWVDGWVGK